MILKMTNPFRIYSHFYYLKRQILKRQRDSCLQLSILPVKIKTKRMIYNAPILNDVSPTVSLSLHTTCAGPHRGVIKSTEVHCNCHLVYWGLDRSVPVLLTKDSKKSLFSVSITCGSNCCAVQS